MIEQRSCELLYLPAYSLRISNGMRRSETDTPRDSYDGERAESEGRRIMSTQHNFTAAGTSTSVTVTATFACSMSTTAKCDRRESRIATSREAFQRRFSGAEPMLVAIETGTHSPWVSRRMLEDRAATRSLSPKRQEGASHLRRGTQARHKVDAEKLARLARLDPTLLSPIKHRGESSQAHLALLCTRERRWWGRGRSSST
jgi:hypothetical protein